MMLCENIQRWLRRVRKLVRSVFISWLLPGCLSAPPLASGWRVGEGGRRASSSLLLLSSLPEALAESEELLLPVLLICSITSTSARNSASSNTHLHSLLAHPVDQSIKDDDWIWSSGWFLELLTSLDVIQLRLGGGVILWRWGGFGADPRLDGGSEQRAGLVGANRLLLDPGLDLAAALSPKTQKTCHPESSESIIGRLRVSSLPGFLHLDAAAQFLQHKLPSVVVDDEHAVLLVRTLVSFENCHGRRGALEGKQCEWARPTYTPTWWKRPFTGIWGNVMVTSSPFPTCSSPSQLVSIDAGLKSSEKVEHGGQRKY